MITDETMCHRHGDRQAAVGCQRCDRPICSSCMTTASVGFHCPDCTKSGAQRVYRPQDLVAQPRVTFAIIGLCVLAFLGQLATGGGDWGAGWVADEGILFGPFVELGEYWRIVTVAFLHAGLFHLLMNMYALYIFGPLMERIVGAPATVLIYAGGLFGASAAVLMFDFLQPTVGASGAVLGLAGGLAGIFVAQGRDLRQTNLMGIFIINLLLPLIFPISFWGHFGGMVGGFAVGWVVATAIAGGRERRNQALGAGAGVVLALAAAAVLAGAVGGFTTI